MFKNLSKLIDLFKRFEEKGNDHANKFETGGNEDKFVLVKLSDGLIYSGVITELYEDSFRLHVKYINKKQFNEEIIIALNHVIFTYGSSFTEDEIDRYVKNL